MTLHLAPGDPVTPETLRAELVRRRDAACSKLTAHMELVKNSERELGEIDAALAAHDAVIAAFSAEPPARPPRRAKRDVRGMVLGALPASANQLADMFPDLRLSRIVLALEGLQRKGKVHRELVGDIHQYDQTWRAGAQE